MADSQVRFAPRGPCAILPSAIGVAFDPVQAGTTTVAGDTAVVDILGPLTHHFSAYGLDSYDAILCRVADVCKTQAKTVVLAIDSPGGDVYGTFDLARAIRAACQAAGKQLVAHISGAGASAAYALACAADRIYASSTACVGSIGVIDLMVSVVRQDAAMGIDTATVTSGERKADGNPHVPLSEAAVAAHQAHVDDLAAVFFGWVAERRNISLDAVQGFQAAVFVGARAKDVGLIDDVADFHSLQEILNSGTITATARNVPQGSSTMATPQANSKYVDAMAALAAAAEEGDERARAAMKKMAAAVAEDKSDGDEKKPDAKAEGDEPAKDEKKEPEKAQAAAAVPGADLDLVKTVIELKAAAAARDAREERATLIATRPDLTADPQIKAMLETATLETVREICKRLPKAQLVPPAQAKPTQGATAGTTTGLPADESAELKARMGLTPHPVASVQKVGVDLTIFGATPEQAAKIAAERGF